MNYKIYHIKEPVKCCNCKRSMNLIAVDYTIQPILNCMWRCPSCNIRCVQMYDNGISDHLVYFDKLERVISFVDIRDKLIKGV